MTYTPKTWNNGDIIYADDMNHIENGIAGVEEDLSDLTNDVADLTNDVAALEVPAVVAQAASDWLTEHITNPSSPPLDNSLSVASAAADAKAAGDAINDLDMENDMQYGFISELQASVLGQSYFHMDYQIGRFIDNGYSTAHKANANNIQFLPAGKYNISAISNSYYYSVYIYNSDSSGTRILAEKYAATTNLNVTANAKVNVRKADGTNMTETDLLYIEQTLKFFKISDTQKYHTLTSGSADNIVEEGYYTIGGSVTDLPTVSGVNMYVAISSSDKQWIQQYLFDVTGGNNIYFRNGRNQSGVYVNNGVGLSVTWGNWKRLLNESDLVAIQPNVGYKIVCLGDSVFGNERGDTSIPGYIEDISGATVYNCALGGTRAGGRSGSSETITKWKTFDFVKLTESIASETYTTQIAALDATGVPSYFTDVFNTILPSIDFTEIDIVIINYGGNDYQGGNEIGSATGVLDPDTYLGGLATGIDNLLTAYPNIRILLVGPPFKYFLTGGVYSGDGDTETFNTNNDTLADFAEALVSLKEVYHSPLVDLYNDLGINKYNYAIWFISGDGSHPNADGRLMTAKLVCKYLRGM